MEKGGDWEGPTKHLSSENLGKSPEITLVKISSYGPINQVIEWVLY